MVRGFLLPIHNTTKMKINNQQLEGKNTKTVIIVRNNSETPLKLSALPPGYDDLMAERGLHTRPVPPLKWAKEASGKVKRDPVTGQGVQEPNYDDPEYIKKASAYYRRRGALTLAAGLRESDVQFDAQPPVDNNPAAWLEYADALAAEVYDPEHGFTEAEVLALIDHIQKLACVLKVEEAQNSFLDLQ